jgi:SagB-type dehydrogenase family enzyme
MLDKPEVKGGPTLNQALAARRSVRSYGRRALTREETSQLLWAAQGVTSPDGWRTAPSAGGTQPLELHLLTSSGVFRYDPGKHQLERLADDDRRARLSDAALGQRCVREAPAVFVIAGVISRTSWKYGERAERYVAIEAGAAGQNLLLQAAALNLGAVYIGAFHDREVVEIAELPDKAVPYGVIPVGAKR